LENKVERKLKGKKMRRKKNEKEIIFFLLFGLEKIQGKK